MKLSEVLALQKKKMAGGGTPSSAHPKAQPAPGNTSAIKVIRTRETPNPSALQFVLNSQILENGNLAYTTMFTNFPGTMMTLRTSFPSVYFCTDG